MLIVDRFEIDVTAVLGTGGFGQVFKARDVATGECVAAKVIDSKRMRREKILQEIQLMERVAGHQGVIGLRGAQEVAEKLGVRLPRSVSFAMTNEFTR